MAERRMFAKTIIGSDAFLDMPQSTQALYFHLSMRADDDGFVNSPKSIMRLVGCKDDDLRILCSKKFIIPFDSGIVVIKHWKIHNYIAKDRYTETKYKKERDSLSIDENGSYTNCIQIVDESETQGRLGKDRIGKDKEESGASAPTPVDSNKVQFGEFRRVFLKQEEYDKLSKIYPDHIAKQITALDSYLENHPQKKYKSHYATIVGWMNKDDIKPKPIKHYCKSCDNELLNKGPNAGTCQNDECDMYHKEQI